MNDQTVRARRFLDLHRPGDPLLLPNPWDRGSARVLEALGFQALATTSGGFAMTLGRNDGEVTRDEALAHAADLVAGTDLPVTADLENGFGHRPADVAQTVHGALDAGLAGASIEDHTGEAEDPIYDLDLATERIAAAAAAAHGGRVPFVLTARAENYLHGRPDLGDTITRLRAYADAGADVLFAPGLTDLDEIRQLVAAVPGPVNILALDGTPPVHELAAAGVARVSVGSGLARAAYATLLATATDFRDQGIYSYTETPGRPELSQIFS